VFEQLHGFWRQRQETKFLAFAWNAKLCFGKERVVAIQSQYFGGAEPLQKHQAHDGQVAGSAETRPEARYFIHRERHDVAFGHLHSQPAHRYSRPAKTHRPSPQKSLMKAAGDLAGSIGDGHTVIDGGRGRPRLLAGLELHIIQER